MPTKSFLRKCVCHWIGLLVVVVAVCFSLQTWMICVSYFAIEPIVFSICES